MSETVRKISSWLLIASGIIFIFFLFLNWNEIRQGTEAFFGGYTEASTFEPNAILLAGIQDGTSTPSTNTIRSFDILLEKLKIKCSLESKDQIAQALVRANKKTNNIYKKTDLYRLTKTIDQNVSTKKYKATTCIETIEAFALLRTL